MNEIQTRIIDVMAAIVQPCTREEIRERGNIPKTMEIIAMNLRSLERAKRVELNGAFYSLVKKPPATRRKKAPAEKSEMINLPVTVGELEDAVKEIDKDIEADVMHSVFELHEPMERLKQKMNADVVEIADYQLKRDTLMHLKEILEDSIASVLSDILHDLDNCNKSLRG
jgi:hypothetical protein